MLERVQLARRKGCDAIDPDNIDGYENNNGLNLTEKDSVKYMKYLTKNCRKQRIAIGLKNGNAIVKKVVHIVDFSVQEECVRYDECDAFYPFSQSKKAVFHVEYPKGSKNNDKPVSQKLFKKYCNMKTKTKMSSILKNLNLDSWIQMC